MYNIQFSNIFAKKISHLLIDSKEAFMENTERYKRERMTVNLHWANIFAILLLIPIILIFGLPYYLIWGIQYETYSLQNSIGNFWIILLAIFFGIIVHELIHGVVWAKFAKNGFKSIKFGVLWKMITPYCHCKEPLKLKEYLLGAIMPAIILGFIPAILAIIIGNEPLLAFGMLFTLAAGGDFLIIYTLWNEKKDTLVEDHPSEAGCYVYRLIEENEYNETT